MARMSAVSAGQRYIKSYHLTRDRTEWEVVVVKLVGTALPHAQLVNCHDPSDTRTVSCAELLAGGVYDLAAESGADDGSGDSLGHPGRVGRNALVRIGAESATGAVLAARLVRQITLAVRRFKRTCARVPIKGQAVLAAVRDLRHTD